jgi:hypothetical protein
MTKPVEPVDPSPKVGDGKSFIERMQRGMKNDDPEIKKQFAERLEKYVNEGKVLNEQRNEYKRNLGTSPIPSGGGGAGPALGDIEKMMSGRIKKPNYKKGGNVSTTSHKKALEKAGFYDKDKTKSEREKIVSKATTKPQRISMVEKLFSAKKMNAGGMASKRADGIAIRGRTRA